MPRSLFLLLCIALLPISQSALFADLIVEQAFHLCRVIPNDGNIQQEAFDLLNPSPYDLSHTALLSPSSCSGTYQGDWAADSATFNVGMNHHLQGFRGSTTGTGTIFVRPSIDSILTLDGSFYYDHYPSLLGAASFIVSVRKGLGPSVFSSGGGGGTFDLEPPFGTLRASGSVPLLAGQQYRINYVFDTANFDPPPPQAVWAGDGGFAFTIAPAPEPSSALFLLIPALSIPGRRHHRIEA